MKLVRMMTVGVALLVLAFGATYAQDWDEHFDSYVTGSGIIGQGGWEGWDGDLASDAYVSGEQWWDPPNSLRLVQESDVVHQFSGLMEPTYLVAAATFYPSDATGYCYFILMSQYSHGGPYEWMGQIQFGNGFVTCVESGGSTELITDQWVNLTIEVDFVGDYLTAIYNGVWLGDWAQTGAETIAAIDLFADDGTEFYFDVMELGPGVIAVEPSSLSKIKALY